MRALLHSGSQHFERYQLSFRSLDLVLRATYAHARPLFEFHQSSRIPRLREEVDREKILDQDVALKT